MTEDFVFPPEMDPKGVTCTRGRIPNMTFDAELAWYGKHYVIKTGCTTRKEADELGKYTAEQLKQDLLAAGTDFVSKYKEAKP